MKCGNRPAWETGGMVARLSCRPGKRGSREPPKRQRCNGSTQVTRQLRQRRGTGSCSQRQRFSAAAARQWPAQRSGGVSKVRRSSVPPIEGGNAERRS